MFNFMFHTTIDKIISVLKIMRIKWLLDVAWQFNIKELNNYKNRNCWIYLNYTHIHRNEFARVFREHHGHLRDRERPRHRHNRGQRRLQHLRRHRGLWTLHRPQGPDRLVPNHQGLLGIRSYRRHSHFCSHRWTGIIFILQWVSWILIFAFRRIIFESILTTFKASFIIESTLISSKN